MMRITQAQLKSDEATSSAIDISARDYWKDVALYPPSMRQQRIEELKAAARKLPEGGAVTPQFRAARIHQMTNPATQLHLCKRYLQLCADLSEADKRDDIKSLIQIHRALGDMHRRLCIEFAKDLTPTEMQLFCAYQLSGAAS